MVDLTSDNEMPDDDDESDEEEVTWLETKKRPMVNPLEKRRQLPWVLLP